MSEVINLRELERKAWRSVFQDGLYDIFLGCMILQMGLIPFLSHLTILLRTSINIGLYVLWCLLLWLGKRYITVPRIGRVKFNPRRRSKIKIVSVITLIFLVLTFGLTLVAVSNKSLLPDNIKGYLPLIMSLFLWGFFSIGAYLFEYTRLYFIAVMFALPEIVYSYGEQFFGIDFGYLAWVVPAVVVIGMGFIVLRRFLRDYPVTEIPMGELANENH